MIRRIANIFLTAAIGIASAEAMPALPKLITYAQPDGTKADVYLRGDENFHYYETPDGAVAMADAEGFICYAALDADGRLYAGPVRLGQNPSSVVSVSDLSVRFAIEKAPKKILPGEIRPTFPTVGSVRGLIILAEYQDVKMSEVFSMEHYKNMLNGENYKDGRIVGSVRDYFVAQSGGKFVPEFDVVGPVTLPNERAYYGVSENLVDQTRDACLAADKDFDVDFTRYDSNDDGFVDFVFIIYAGHGESQGGSPQSVWPAMMDYSNKIFDYFDGMNLSVSACSSELSGAEDSDPALDGIGTICHEFSHILGLPDIYDTGNGDGHGMGHFDLLCNGGYNGDSFIPSGYTAMDRYYVGWLDPVVLEGDRKDVSLAPLSTSGEAFFIVNPNNANEYYTLENRQWSGWDEEIPGHGLVISQITFDPSLWKRNLVNTPGRNGSYEHVRIVAADNSWIYNASSAKKGTGSEAGDPFPGKMEKTEYSASTVPAAKWLSTKEQNCNFSITNIREKEDGTILFDFSDNASGVEDIISEEGISYDRRSGMLAVASEAQIYTLSGIYVRAVPAGQHSLSDLTGSLYVVVSDGKSMIVKR